MEIVTAEAHADDTTVPFHPRVLRRPENTRECAYSRAAYVCFVFAVRRNVSGQTMGRVGQRRYSPERAGIRGGYEDDEFPAAGGSACRKRSRIFIWMKER